MGSIFQCWQSALAIAAVFISALLVTTDSAANDFCRADGGSTYTFTVTLNINRTGHKLVMVNMNHETPFHVDKSDDASLQIQHSSTACGKKERIELTTTAILLEHIRPKGDGYEYFPDVGYYKLHTYGRTWDEARAICLEEGGHLLVINDEAEANVVKQFFARNPVFTNVNDPLYGAYVGISDREKEGKFVTVTGQRFEDTGYTKWQPGEPTPNDRGQNFVAVERNGLFHDINNGMRMAFICEIE